MALSLQKGQSLSLTKSNGSTLTKVRLGLGWDSAVPAKRGFFGKAKPVEVDLDASAIFFDVSGKALDTVFFNQLTSKDGSTVHTGDNLTGEGDGDDETILVDLTSVNSKVAHIVFVISSYTGQTFNEVENAFSRLIDDSAPGSPEVARFQLTEAGSHTAMVMSKISRQGDGWTFQAIGEKAHGKTVNDLIAPASLATR